MGELGGEWWRVWDGDGESTAYVASIGTKIQNAGKVAFDVLAIAIRAKPWEELGS